jgi:hypothetical protein
MNELTKQMSIGQRQYDNKYHHGNNQLQRIVKAQASAKRTYNKPNVPIV